MKFLPNSERSRHTRPKHPRLTFLRRKRRATDDLERRCGDWYTVADADGMVSVRPVGGVR